MQNNTSDIVAKLWNLCHILRDDGITYNEYVTELTFLLFLKMMQETGHESRIPNGYRWAELARREGLDQLDYYRRLLLDLGNTEKSSDPTVLAIFTDAQTRLRKPANLKALTAAIDRLDWFSAREEGLGNLYEGLLEKNAAEKKSGAGQYFTARPLIDCMVRVIKPQPGETMQDPAAGTGGFIVAVDHYIKERTDALFTLSAAEAHFQRHEAFRGAELVPDAHRLCLMNLMLHGIEGSVLCADTLSPDGEQLGKADPGGYDGEDRTAVVISEALDNPGMSVTNASEDIATQIVQAFNLDPARTRWIEHYPQEAWRYHGREEIKPATYDEVFYHWRGLEAREPNWRRMPLEEIEILTGEEPD